MPKAVPLLYAALGSRLREAKVSLTILIDSFNTNQGEDNV
jgi:hypothetical protein